MVIILDRLDNGVALTLIINDSSVAGSCFLCFIDAPCCWDVVISILQAESHMHISVYFLK